MAVRPIVAVVGRPNVGKSTLFNKLIGQRLSIVEDTPGVTRDRIYSACEWRNHEIMLVDTGGIEPYSDDIIISQMRRQAQMAIESAEVIILVVDMKSGITATDQEVAAMLQKSGKPIVLCVNKCDGVGEPPSEFYEFYNLGLGEPIAVSSPLLQTTFGVQFQCVAGIFVQRKISILTDALLHIPQADHCTGAVSKISDWMTVEHRSDSLLLCPLQTGL